jgi:hypothetical protein
MRSADQDQFWEEGVPDELPYTVAAEQFRQEIKCNKKGKTKSRTCAINWFFKFFKIPTDKTKTLIHD